MSPFGPRDDAAHDDVLAAGAVLWRPGRDGGPEIALVHRPRYDDWSFPKGKSEQGESLPFTAVREIAEETGQRARLGAILGDVRYPVPEGTKLVRYWAATALGGRFIPNSEVDQLIWASIDRAADRLSYRHDMEVLRRFVDTGPATATVVLVRHAKAGSRSRWHGDDALRPLSPTGHRQAVKVTPLLWLFGPDRLVSAAPLRCRQTLAPLAQRMGGAPIAEEPLFGEEPYWVDPIAGRERLVALAAEPVVSVVSSQGGVIPDLVGVLGKRAGVDPGDVPARKASTWLLTFVDGQVQTADYYPPPE